MGDDAVSKDEVNALLGDEGTSDNEQGDDSSLSPEEIDALGEISNISIGTSATTLNSLLGQKVSITTPKVSLTTWEEFSKNIESPCVEVKVEFIEGLSGNNLLILKDNDVKIITDLMMNGEGKVEEGELTDLNLSAISEAMSQMVGSASTSLSSMFENKIVISPPKARVIKSEEYKAGGENPADEKIVNVSFKMEVGDLIDSEMMQVIPLDFAKKLVVMLLEKEENESSQEKPEQPTEDEISEEAETTKEAVEKSGSEEKPQKQEQSETKGMKQKEGSNIQEKAVSTDEARKQSSAVKGPVEVQTAQFQNLENDGTRYNKKNISLVLDVPLDVSIELGKTKKIIRDILEFGPGSIIELDRIAGEPVDIVVNGKYIAKGEVVVIDENFGIRITDIVHPSKRL